MINWFYKGEAIIDISQLPENAYGIIYKIWDIRNDKFYIGKKNLYSERNIKLGKKALAALPDKRMSKKKKIKKESDWKDYWGSEEELKLDIETYGLQCFRRTILYICYDKTTLTYQELRHQILHGCLESDICYNKQLLGKFFKKAAK